MYDYGAPEKRFKQEKDFIEKLKDPLFLEKARIALKRIQSKKYIYGYEEIYLSCSLDIILGPIKAKEQRLKVLEVYKNMNIFEFLDIIECK